MLAHEFFLAFWQLAYSTVFYVSEKKLENYLRYIKLFIRVRLRDNCINPLPVEVSHLSYSCSFCQFALAE